METKVAKPGAMAFILIGEKRNGLPTSKANR
jgi:hypothetical protein